MYRSREVDTIDLATLLERVPNATITVQLSDLNAFARRLIADTREEYEQEISDRLLAIKENYLTADTVKDVLQISETTLWRWAKAGYLLPVMIGGQKRYKQSDIEKMVVGEVEREIIKLISNFGFIERKDIINIMLLFVLSNFCCIFAENLEQTCIHPNK